MTGIVERLVGPRRAGLRDAYPDPRAFLRKVRAGLAPDEATLLLRQLYSVWLVALLCKALGSSWDVSWHFKWLRDDLAPPHLVNVAGDTIMIALVIFHTLTGFGVDKIALRLMQAGCLVFLLSIPLDVINHRLNGLDITSWSVTHAGLYSGTALAIAGAIRGWTTHAARLPGRNFLLGALWLFFLENVLFTNQQQEYGVLSIRAYVSGRPTAEPSLLAFAANQAGVPAIDLEVFKRFALPIPAWVYLVWVVAAAALVLVNARKSVGWRWTATTIAAAYVAYRCVMFLVLIGMGFPRSTVPFLLIAAGLAVDLVCLLALSWPIEAVLGSVVVTGAVYGACYLQTQLLAAPPVVYSSAPYAAAALAVGWLVAAALWHRAAVRSADIPAGLVIST